ncbi:MAG: MBL fold metallo-hydrolase [Chloroflexota bacterium]|nr:MBL fold metallo-hydrolase [Chloroflexota bacterium]
MKLTENVFSYPESGMMDCNTYAIRDDITVVIDPGFDQYFPNLVQAMEKDGIDPKEVDIIVNTHLHLDHYWASESLKKISGAKILMHPVQRESYDLTVVQVSGVFGIPPVHLTEDELLEGNLNTGKLEFEVLSSPGHSPDSICFYCKEQGVMISGDVVFAGNTGRVDFPGGSAKQLKESIESLTQREIEYLLPGHMGIVSGAKKVKDNFEFVRKNVFPWL